MNQTVQASYECNRIQTTVLSTEGSDILTTKLMFLTDMLYLHLISIKCCHLLSGMDDNSWGLSYKGTIWHGGKCWRYCEPFYDDRTVIAVHLNLYEGTISFSKNGKNLGVAFSGLNNLDQQLFPLISSTATETELAVGKRTCRYMSLQELCYLTIAKSMKHKYQAVNRLPLPRVMQNCVTDLI